MSGERPDQLGLDILAALRIPSDGVSSLTLRIDATSFPVVQINRWVDADDGNDIVSVVEQYEVRRKPDITVDDLL